MFVPHLWIIGHERAKAGKECSIEFIGLVVCLWMIRSCKGDINSKLSTCELEKRGNELRAIIRKGHRRGTVRQDPVCQECMSHGQCSNVSKWHCVCHFVKTVRDHQDVLMTVRRMRQAASISMATDSSSLAAGNNFSGDL